MSSIFTGLLDVLGPIRNNRQPLEITKGYQQLHIGHVLDVILDQDSPYYFNDHGLGVIHVRLVLSDSTKGENNITVFAPPADRCNYQVPLPGEQVLLYSVLENGKRYYVYGSIIKQDLSIVYNSQPFLGTKAIFIDPLTLYAFADVPTLAKRFEDKLHIPADIYIAKSKLYTNKREGDTLIEGRFGAQIHFTSTIEEHQSLGQNLLETLQINTPTIAGNEIVKPMLTEDGDPLTVLQVSRKRSVDEPTFVEYEGEAVNEVDSVVYLTSTQEIPMAINTSKRMASWDVEVLRQDPNQLKAKSDSIRLQSTFSGVYDPNFRFTVNLNLTVPSGDGGYSTFNPQNLTQGTKSENIKAIIARMSAGGITNPYAVAAYLGCIGKESQWIPQTESGYATTAPTRSAPGRGLKELFGGRLKAYLAYKGKGYSDTDVADLSGLSANKAAGTNERLLQPYQTEFYDAIYGYLIKTDDYKGDNTNPGDGLKYRGRGLNQVTFKKGYKDKSDAVGIDLVSDPDALNGVDVAVEVAFRFLTEGLKRKNIDPNSFTTLDQACREVSTVNAGAPSTPAYNKTLESAHQVIAAGYVTGI